MQDDIDLFELDPIEYSHSYIDSWMLHTGLCMVNQLQILVWLRVVYQNRFPRPSSKPSLPFLICSRVCCAPGSGTTGTGPSSTSTPPTAPTSRPLLRGCLAQCEPRASSPRIARSKYLKSHASAPNFLAFVSALTR